MGSTAVASCMRTWGLPIFCSLAPSILRLLETPGRALWPLLLATLVRIFAVCTHCCRLRKIFRCVDRTKARRVCMITKAASKACDNAAFERESPIVA